MRIVWTDISLRDLAAARAFIARENPTAADRQIERVFAAVATLLDFPEIGRVGRREGTRELVIGRTPYIAAYRLRGDAIEILRVLHERQRWPETF